MNTLAQIAASYGVTYADLATIVGIDGVDPHRDLNTAQTELVVRLIEASDFFAGSGRHRF